MEFIHGQELGTVLKEARRARMLTLKEVADYTNCSVSYINKLENSAKAELHSNILRKLADLYELDLNILQAYTNQIDSSEDVKNHFNKVESFFSDQDVPALVQAALAVVSSALEQVK